MPAPDLADTVHTARDGAVWTITLHRPHKRNAVDRALADALDAALNTLDDDADLRVGVLYGGPSVFCAGSDLASRGDYVTARGGEYGIIRRQRRKPLIAAVEGMALGGGLEIALACDMVVAAHNARLGLPEVQRGVLPTCGALFRALQALPPHIARELVLAGQPMAAARAHALGLVNHLAEPGHALVKAQALAAQVAANAPLSVQACLGAMNGLLALADAAGWQATEQALASIRGSDDLEEGLRAFFEKRAPVWSGR
ncbi:enoyl-CoA hydratase-related protein [Pseudorhodoferax sp. Leaf274]|uniref:enoyl-CoA hydratase-related protein n=1 Tax=Pseudorhodoferax sp. Leaf274 TaxID=1736318 RepID=UPI0007038540|nr:enoyl-CoA hydratase-related protein [Pseudorhodoferax sp. Leaf274]KQP36333.1 enoyl-CoA hydratase [Pseudorhodoferax sp. Leaf274]